MIGQPLSSGTTVTEAIAPVVVGPKPWLVALACLVGALLAWKPADHYFDEWHYRHIGPVSAKFYEELARPEITARERERSQSNTYPRRLYEAGVVWLCWGVAIGAMIGLLRFRRPQGIFGAVPGLALGFLVGAGLGFAGGAAGEAIRERLENVPLDELYKTMAYHAVAFVVCSQAIGATWFLLLAPKGTCYFITAARGAVAALLAAALFGPLTGVLFPLSKINNFVPTGSGSRLLWFALPAVLIGLAVPQGPQAPPGGSTDES